MTKDDVRRLGKFVALVAVAVFVGFVVALGGAMLGHEYLVRTVGEEGIPALDDTPLMAALVGAAYLAGGLAGLVILVAGRARLLRRRR